MILNDTLTDMVYPRNGKRRKNFLRTTLLIPRCTRNSWSQNIDFFADFEEPSIENFMGLSFFLENLFGKKVEILTPAGVESIRINHVKEEIKRSIVYA